LQALFWAALLSFSRWYVPGWLGNLDDISRYHADFGKRHLQRR
jgi:hypothetical protein